MKDDDLDARFAEIVAGLDPVTVEDLDDLGDDILDPLDPLDPQPRADGSSPDPARDPDLEDPAQPVRGDPSIAPGVLPASPRVVWRSGPLADADPPELSASLDGSHGEADDGDDDLDAGLDSFEPPDPGPLPPSHDHQFWGIVLGLTGGPLLLLWLLLTQDEVSGWLGMLGAAMTVGGFALLVLRQPTDRDETDDGVRL